MQGGKQHWDQVYRDKMPGEVSWYQAVPELSLSLISNAGLEPDDPIIDVGGGASVLVDHLLRTGCRRLAVLDIAETALDHARARLGRLASDIEWYQADVTAFRPPHEFSLWHDRAVFHFLVEAAQRRAYVRVLNQTLPIGGHLIIAAFAIGGPSRCSGLDIVQYDADKLIAELGPGLELLEQAMESHRTPAGKAQLFGYYRFVRI